MSHNADLFNFLQPWRSRILAFIQPTQGRFVSQSAETVNIRVSHQLPLIYLCRTVKIFQFVFVEYVTLHGKTSKKARARVQCTGTPA